MLDPNLSAREAAQLRQLKFRQRRPNYSREYDKVHRPSRERESYAKRLPFVAVDGEGGGHDPQDRQQYLLIRAGDDLLFHDNQDLTTDDCLGFLSGLSDGCIHVAFYFDYDVTMILRHVSRAQRERILRPIPFAVPGERRATYVGDYEVEYMPRKYFKVRRIGEKRWVTINDVGTFFQCSFVKAITDWETGTAEERAVIKENKARRDTFDKITTTEIEYNRLECEHLVELMTKFREVCVETGYVPPAWQGPGYLASNMMKTHNVVKAKTLGLDPQLLDFANAAYYGGRFELFKIGSVKGVHEYDINSAYPTAMLELPCLEHGTWEMGKGKPPQGKLYVASVQFRNENCAIADLPIRDKKTGSIYWPFKGNGIYWSLEIEAALRSKTTIREWRTHWVYHRQCDCTPFDFVNEVYLKRKAIGKGTRGYSLKLAINSLYGKTAQSIGSAPYANPIWAGLITAHCRARLIDAYTSIDSRDVVMLATDGIYTRVPLSHLVMGTELGQWDHKLHEEMFFVQPGIYFSNISRPKTRGIPLAVVAAKEAEFRAAFTQWQDEPLNLFGVPQRYPIVEVPLHAFIGMKLAQAWGKPFLAGKWLDTTRHISFDFRSKREFAMIELDKSCVHTFPRQGSFDLTSQPYSKTIGTWRKQAQEFSALIISQPDLLAFAPHEQSEVHGT